LGLARRERYDTTRENGTLEMSMMYKSSVDIVHDVQRLLMCVREEDTVTMSLGGRWRGRYHRDSECEGLPST